MLHEKLDSFFPSKFLNPFRVKEILSKDYVPPKIIDRDSQKKELCYWFFDNLKTDTSHNILITGYSGTGKTAVVKWLIKNKELNGYLPIYILCRDRTGFEIWKNISSYISDYLREPKPKGRASVNFSDYIKDRIEKNDLKVLLVLDEIDSTLKKEKSDDFLNLLLHLQREIKRGRIALILISNTREFFKNEHYEITDATSSRLSPIPISFNVYNIADSGRILELYARQILIPELLEKEGNGLLGKLIKFSKVVSEFNVRRLIEDFVIWVKRCAELKKDGLDLSCLDDEYFTKLRITKVLEDEKNLNVNQKIMHLSLIKAIIDVEELENKISRERKRRIPEKYFYVSRKRWIAYYVNLCQILGVEPLKERAFWYYMDKLREWNLIECTPLSKGIRGRKGIYLPSDRVRDNLKEVVNLLCEELKIWSGTNVNLKEVILFQSWDHVVRW